MTDNNNCNHAHVKINLMRPLLPTPTLYKGTCVKCGFVEWIITSKKENEPKIRAEAFSFNGRFRRSDGR